MQWSHLRSFVGVALFSTLICASLARADILERIGHTTLQPRHSNPDDRGMYAAAIDPTNGYAYFIGQYLVKVDITGNLPVQVGPALNVGQSAEADIDSSAGYLYVPRAGAIYRYAVGAGTNAVSSAGSLTLAAGSPLSIAIDSSDPNPTNHYAYVVCSGVGSRANVAKVALGTFTELGSIQLNDGETNFVFCTVTDPRNGYAYFLARGGITQQVVKVKFTAGANAPLRSGADTFGTNIFFDGASIAPVHGFAYYGTYNSDTNIPSQVYKVKLGQGDVAPTVLGFVTLQPGEGRLAASVTDPQGGYVYFADDNTYPGHVYQLSMNGTNLPVEIGRLALQPGWSNSPPDGVTASNTTTNNDGLLPFGEVYFRSAVYDSVGGFAYFGQDSRPNQVVKVQLRSGFELWQSAYFGDNATNSAVAGDFADPDGDGVPNLLEYALQMNPSVPDAGGLPVMGDTNGFLTLTYTRDPNATDINYIPEVSNDLQTWTNGPAFVTQSVLSSNAATMKVLAQDLVPVSVANERFIRLHIARSP